MAWGFIDLEKTDSSPCQLATHGSYERVDQGSNEKSREEIVLLTHAYTQAADIMRTHSRTNPKKQGM